MDKASGNVRNLQELRAKRLIQASDSSARLVSLNFKVPLRVRQQFKICAANLDLTMTELLLRVLSDSVFSPANHMQQSHPNESKSEKIEEMDDFHR